VIGMRAQVLQHRQSYDEEGVRIIREQAQRMTRLVDDLVDTVRLEAGQLELRLEELDLNVVAREAVDRAQTQTERHLIHVSAADSPVMSAWDRTRLEEVLDNLLGNAIKYSPQGGVIVVRVAATDRESQLSVTDQGEGIPAETLPQLFERFQRGASSETAGIGLGLYIIRLLVEAHGGRVEAQSVPGEGSVFTIRLPRIDSPGISSGPVTHLAEA
jgi:signal transduction histidine kinase